MKNWKPALTGGIAVSFSAALWGLDGVVLTPRLYNLEVPYVVFMLHLLPFILMNLFLYKHYRHIGRMTYNDLGSFFLVALFGGALGTISIVQALFLVNFQELSVVVLLQKLQPVFAIILAALILKERVHRRFYFWAIMAIIASYFLTFGWSLPVVSRLEKLPMAAGFALLAAFSFALATVMGKKVSYKHNFKTVTFVRYGLTSAILLPVVIINGSFFQQIPVTTPENWIIFLIIGATTGSGAIFLYYFGLKRVKAMVATICELFFPLSAILLDYLINDNQLTAIQWASAAALITAVISINLQQKKNNG